MKLTDQLKEALSLKDVLDFYGETYKETPKYLRTNCPSHNQFDLMHYFESKKTWCYGCSWTGDIFSYIMEKDKLDFPAAVEKACKIAGIEYKPDNLTPQQIEDWRKEKQVREESYSLFKNKITEYHTNLKKYPDLIDYCKSRGLTEESIDKLKIGFIIDDTDEKLLNIGLVGKTKEGKIFCPYKKRLVLPYFNLNGEPIYAIFRETKYTYKPKDNSKDNRFKKLYASSQIKHTLFYYQQPESIKDTIIISEGIFDAYSVIQAGYDTASFITVQPKESDLPELFPIVKDYKKIIVIFDNEDSESGQKGTKKLVETLFNEGYTNTMVYTIPKPVGINKIDLNDVLKELSVEEQKEKLKEIELNSIEAIEHLCGDLKFKTATDRTNSYNYLSELLDPIYKLDELFFWELLKDIAQYTNQKESVVKNTLKQKMKIEAIEKNKETQKQVVDGEQFQGFMRILNDNFNYRALAKRLVNEVGIYYNENGVWFVWNYKDSCWQIKDDTDIMNHVDKALNNTNETFQSHIKTTIIESLKREARKKTPKEFPKDCIQFKNIVYNYETGESFPASKEYLCFNPTPWKVGDSEDTPTFDKLFVDWVGEENKDLLYEILAYSLSHEYFLQDIFAFIGGGSNGKSTFLGILEKFNGEENCGTISLDRIMQGARFEKCKIYKKRLAFLTETNYKGVSRTGELKSLSGGDTQGYEFKGKNGELKDKNYAKLIISSNGLPETDDKSDGFFRRWVIIEFKNKFKVGKNPVDLITNEEYENMAKKSLSILKRLRETYSFTNEKTMEQKRVQYEDISNPLTKFIDEFYEKDMHGEVPCFQFQDKFNNYLSHNGIREMSKTEITKKMTSIGFENKPMSVPKPNGDGYTTWRHYVGIREKGVFEKAYL